MQNTDIQNHLDLVVLQELHDVLGTEFPVLVTTFVADSEARIAAIHAAQVAGDAEALRDVAHSFRGSCLNIGAHRVAAACRTLESFSRAGDAAAVARQIPLLESACQAACAHLVGWVAR